LKNGENAEWSRFVSEGEGKKEMEEWAFGGMNGFFFPFPPTFVNFEPFSHCLKLQ